jgi:tetratricopeptide (TPR) repeat protein
MDLALEGRYLAALAELALGRRSAAVAELRAVSQSPGSPTAALALALLGSTEFAENHLEETVRCWQALDPKQRQSLGLGEPLGLTLFARALELLLAGHYEESAEQFRQAGRHGCRDRRLGPLLLLALVKAGQKAVYGDATAPVRAAADQALSRD